jgi:ferredoxin
MINLTIDNRQIEAPEGTSVWQAAKSAGIDIPVMCYLEETGHIASCMICLVKNTKNGQLFASCSTPVSEGQIIVTNDNEVTESRKTALELLLSEHVGDCEAPCQAVCPAHMNIPLMNRLIAKGEFAKSLEVVKRDIALPSILGRICPAPCEAACRRKQVDDAVSICTLKRFVGDEDLNSVQPYRPKISEPTGKTVAIIGSGPAGLAAAYYLQIKGHQAVLCEQADRPGGALLHIDKNILPDATINSEIDEILALGVQLHTNATIDKDRFANLQKEFDAIVVATGMPTSDGISYGLATNNAGILADKLSYQTSIRTVFAIGNALRTSKMAVRSVGQGKEVAAVIDNYFNFGEITGFPARFNSKFGRLMTEEFVHYLKDSETVPCQSAGTEGFTVDSAMLEARRCMHCDCRKPESCLLREYSDQYLADQKRFKGEERKTVEKLNHREGIVYEPAKCIKCGICVRLTSIHREEFGLTFIGRGFDLKVAVPFNENIELGLRNTALEAAKACPTGALAMFDEEQQLNL